MDEVPVLAARLSTGSAFKQDPNLVGYIVTSPSLCVPAEFLSSPFNEAEIAEKLDTLEQTKKLKPIIKNEIGMEFRLIPPGLFQMGISENELVFDYEREDARPHPVVISRPYYLGIFEVTQEEWNRVMGANPSHFSKGGKERLMVEGLDTSCFPVENVSYRQAQEFVKELNARFAVDGFLYRLPTEAEWEFACRAGTTTKYHFGETMGIADANMNNLSEEPTLKRPTTVGSYGCNAFGLYDMHGNVAEWCSDWKDYYPRSQVVDPRGPSIGRSRIFRGGDFSDLGPEWCRSGKRKSGGSAAGLRIVLSVR